MKANTRQVPGSARSCRTSLSRYTTPPRRSLMGRKSTHKTQTKCIQNRKCNFFNHDASATYNFNAVKCLHFLAPGALLRPPACRSSAAETHDIRITTHGRMLSLLPRGEGQDEGQTGSGFSRDRSVTVHMPSENRVKPNRNARVLHKPCQRGADWQSAVSRMASGNTAIIEPRAVQNRTKQNDFKLRSISPTQYQRLTTTLRPIVRFSQVTPSDENEQN
jgi:hypothetical protein